MKNMMWLASMYPDWDSKVIVFFGWLFGTRAYHNRLVIETKFNYDLNRRWWY